MEYRFSISGEIMSGDNWWSDDYFTPAHLDAHLKEANGRSLFIDIDSVGGCVNSGISIYARLRRYASENNVTIATRSDGFVASIATVIFLAGHRRIVNEFMQPFVHEPWANVWSVTPNEIKKELTALEQFKAVLASFYSKHTTLSLEEANALMENDTWMDADYCKQIGFATEIEVLSPSEHRIAASIRGSLKSKKSIINNQINMTKKKTSLWATINRAMGAISSVKAELELADDAGNSVIFPDLEAEDTPTIGDKVTFQEDANYTGTISTSDYLIEAVDGVVTSITDIKDADLVELVEELTEELEAAAKVIAKQKAQINGMRSAGNPSGERGGRQDKGDGETALQASLRKRRESKNKK